MGYQHIAERLYWMWVKWAWNSSVATVDPRMLQRTKRGNVKIIFKNMQANYSKFRIDCCLKNLPRTKRLNQKKNKVTRNLFFVFSIIF